MPNVRYWHLAHAPAYPDLCLLLGGGVKGHDHNLQRRPTIEVMRCAFASAHKFISSHTHVRLCHLGVFSDIQK
jgi:hypothetical protein